MDKLIEIRAMLEIGLQEIIDSYGNSEIADGYGQAMELIKEHTKGMTLVPNEPTEAMIERFWGEIEHGQPEIDAATEAYKDMLSASKEE